MILYLLLARLEMNTNQGVFSNITGLIKSALYAPKNRSHFVPFYRNAPHVGGSDGYNDHGDAFSHSQINGGYGYESGLGHSGAYGSNTGYGSAADFADGKAYAKAYGNPAINTHPYGRALEFGGTIQNRIAHNDLGNEMFLDMTQRPQPRPLVHGDGKCAGCFGEHHGMTYADGAVMRGQQNYNQVVNRYAEINQPGYAETLARSRTNGRQFCADALLDDNNWNIIMSNYHKRGKFGCEII